MRTFTGFQKGINIGGWLSQYDAATKEHFDTFITQKDIETIASFGVDHVRVPVDYEVFETEEGVVKEEGYAYIDNLISWCAKANLHLVLDLHRTFGYTFDPLEVDGDKEIFFHDAKMQERFFTLWEQFASRYGKYSDMVAFELLNEIVSPHVVNEWNDIAARAIQVIRKYASDAYIIIGGVNYNHVLHVADLNPPVDEKIVYNFHCYDPHIFTHQRAYWVEGMPSDITVPYPQTLGAYRKQSEVLGTLDQTGLDGDPDKLLGEDYFEQLFAPAIQAAQKNGAPLYCGEYGVIDQAPLPDTLSWLKDIHAVFERHGIGRALWTYKEKDFGLIGSHYRPLLEEMVSVL